jgi:hypothetical protein
MHNNIRLSEFELRAIQESFRSCFNSNDRLWLFGSRVDPNRKGGDIDLYVETDCQKAEEVVDAKINFLSSLKTKIGDQKIDLVLKFKETDLLIYKIAREEGVRLV